MAALDTLRAAHDAASAACVAAELAERTRRATTFAEETAHAPPELVEAIAACGWVTSFGQTTDPDPGYVPLSGLASPFDPFGPVTHAEASLDGAFRLRAVKAGAWHGRGITATVTDLGDKAIDPTAHPPKPHVRFLVTLSWGECRLVTDSGRIPVSYVLSGPGPVVYALPAAVFGWRGDGPIRLRLAELHDVDDPPHVGAVSLSTGTGGSHEDLLERLDTSARLIGAAPMVGELAARRAEYLAAYAAH